MNKTLVVYFSPTGNTAAVARIIAATVKGDLFEIKPAEPYTAADLDWNNAQSRSSLEMKDAASRPAIQGKVANMAEYKTIFLGFPIWWYTAPHIILAFLESYDFSGKVIIPFVTSGSSGLGKTEEVLQQVCPGAQWLPGARFAEHASGRAIEDWVKEHNDWKK